MTKLVSSANQSGYRIKISQIVPPNDLEQQVLASRSNSEPDQTERLTRARRQRQRPPAPPAPELPTVAPPPKRGVWSRIFGLS